MVHACHNLAHPGLDLVATGSPPLAPHHFVCVEKCTLPYLTSQPGGEKNAVFKFLGEAVFKFLGEQALGCGGFF